MECYQTTVPSHEVVLLASIFVPDRDVHVAAVFLVQVEVKLLPPLGVQRFGNCLSKQQRGNSSISEKVFLSSSSVC